MKYVIEVCKIGAPCFFMSIPNTVWPENLTGIKFDEIASKLHNKNMTDFKFDEMPGKKAHSIRKINIDGY